LSAALALAAGCTKSGGGTAETLADIPLPVVVQAVSNAPFERSLEVQGSLEAVDSAIVSARIPGPLLSVDVDVGDSVAAGKTVLFAVDPATVSNQAVIAREAAGTARAQVAVAEANVQKAEAVAAKAALDAERFARLHAEGRATDNEHERADTQRAAAEADVAVATASLALARQQVSQAEAQLAIAERQLSDATVLAPFDGTVAARLAEPGEMAAPGKPVVKLVGTRELKAVAFLPARHFGEVVPGETAVEISAGNAEPVEAVVAAKSPAIDPRLRVFEIKALLPGSPDAAPGAMADFRVVFERREGLSVPQEAVLKRAVGTVLFVAQADGTAKEVPVEVGLRDGGRAEILSGLAPGDPVVVQGQTQLSDGRKIAR
jgi:HlyD family secretion protein